MLRVGIVGLGIMGIAYARNLVRREFPVIGNDIDDDRLDALRDIGGEPAQSTREVASGADVILTALPTVTALDAVAREIAVCRQQDQVVVEMSTFPLAAKQRARETLETAAIEMIDAPVSGTGLQAETAEIVVYASGDGAAIERLAPVFDAIASQVFDLGEFGNGSRMKYVANLLVSIHNLATAEAFVLGKRGGLEPRQILDVISAGVGTSRIFEIRAPMMVRGEYPPAAKLKMFIKDITVISDFGKEIGAPTPLLDATLPLYEQAIAEGLGELDAAALAELLESRADAAK